MCRLFPCIPIFRGYFWLKKCKKMCMRDYVKNRIVTCENVFFRFEWRHKRISGLGSPIIHYSQHQRFQDSYFFNNGTSSKEALLQNNCFLEKANFSEQLYSVSPTFSRGLVSEYFFKRPNFLKVHIRYFLKRATFFKLLFQKSYYFTVNFLFTAALSIS